MTKSTLTRERLQEIAEDGFLKHGESKELARMVLAAMDSEPVAEVVSIYGDPEAFGEREIRPLVGIQQMPYGTKLYRHAQPAPELKPVGYLFVSGQGAIAYSPTDWGMPGFKLAGQIFGDIDVESQPAPVVPDELLKEYLRLVDCMLSDYRDSNYGDAQRWIRHIADASDTFEEKHGLSPWEMSRKNFRAAMLQAVPLTNEGDVALHNYRTALEGIGHIRRTLEETFGGLHGTHVEPDVLMECKTICDAIYAAYRGSAQGVPDEIECVATTLEYIGNFADASIVRQLVPGKRAPGCTCPSGDG